MLQRSPRRDQTRLDRNSILWKPQSGSGESELRSQHGEVVWQPPAGLSTQSGTVNRCCGGNKHRFLPNYALSMWMQTKGNGLAATLYGPSTVTAKVGSANQQVQITQETNYPFEEEIRFEIKADRPYRFRCLSGFRRGALHLISR